MDGGSDPATGFFIFFILLAADFLLSLYGAAIQTVAESDLTVTQTPDPKDSPGEDPDDEFLTQRLSEIAKLKENPARLVHACWFYLLISASAGTVILEKMVFGKALPAAALVFVLLYLLGKSIPMVIGKAYHDRAVRLLYRPVSVLMNLSRPFTAVLSFVGRIVLLPFGIDAKNIEDEVTEGEIISMVNEGHEQGVLDESEAEMIQNIFELDDKEASDIMTHRKKIAAIDGCMRLDDAINTMVSGPNSRFPVYTDNIDNIIGALYLKDAMLFHMKEQYNNWYVRDIPGLLREIKFVPETQDIQTLFHSMQEEQVQIAIVVDEYGETSGLVTMEDILEEIVGNILDEYDKAEPNIVPDGSGKFRMRGMTPLDEAEEKLGIEFEDREDYETLNGYLTSRLNRIPEENDHSVIFCEGYRFRILSVKDNTIQWVEVDRAPAKEPDGKREKETK